MDIFAYKHFLVHTSSNGPSPKKLIWVVVTATTSKGRVESLPAPCVKFPLSL